MPTVTLKGMPETLHHRLKTRAREHHRSLNKEILSCLEAAVSVHRIDPQTWLERAAATRSQVRGGIKDADLKAWREAGRVKAFPVIALLIE
jgi:plasmid stability protein